jgi:hypothetical protein
MPVQDNQPSKTVYIDTLLAQGCDIRRIKMISNDLTQSAAFICEVYDPNTKTSMILANPLGEVGPSSETNTPIIYWAFVVEEGLEKVFHLDGAITSRNTFFCNYVHKRKSTDPVQHRIMRSDGHYGKFWQCAEYKLVGEFVEAHMTILNHRLIYVLISAENNQKKIVSYGTSVMH